MWTRRWTFRLHRMRGIYWAAEKLLVSKEGLWPKSVGPRIHLQAAACERLRRVLVLLTAGLRALWVQRPVTRRPSVRPTSTSLSNVDKLVHVSHRYCILKSTKSNCCGGQKSWELPMKRSHVQTLPHVLTAQTVWDVRHCNRCTAQCAN